MKANWFAALVATNGVVSETFNTLPLPTLQRGAVNARITQNSYMEPQVATGTSRLLVTRVIAFFGFTPPQEAQVS